MYKVMDMRPCPASRRRTVGHSRFEAAIEREPQAGFHLLHTGNREAGGVGNQFAEHPILAFPDRFDRRKRGRDSVDS